MLKGVFTSTFPTECFPPEWLDCTVPVFLDYVGHIQPADGVEGTHGKLFGLLPGRAEGQAANVKMDRMAFISAILSRPEFFFISDHSPEGCASYSRATPTR